MYGNVLSYLIVFAEVAMGTQFVSGGARDATRARLSHGQERLTNWLFPPAR